MEEVKCYDSEVANHKLREINVFNYHEDLSPFISEKDELSEREKAETLQIDDFERKLVEIICQDDSTQLICLAKQNSEKSEDSTDQETLDPGVAARLLQLACRLDSVECATVLIEGDTGTVARINEMDAFGRTPLHNAAELHAKKCIDLLLRKNCRTDIRSKDRDALLALEIALFSKRMQVDWSPKESVEELLVLLRERDLSAMRLLAEATKEVGEVAYMRAMEGRIVELAVLLLVAADKITMPVTNHFECYSITKSARSVYDCVLEETLALGEREKRALRPDNQDGCGWDSACSIHERREFFLRGIELLQMFGAVAQAAENTCKEKKVLPPLLRASRIGDEPVVKLLLQSGANVNETDANGNSSLHWCIKRGATSQDLRLTWLLLKHGAKVSQQNRLGLTPVHVAAAKGNYYTLQMLLLQDPECVDIASEAQETPLFFAVKSEFLGCAKLLLSHGANRQALNLLRQRPIEYAKSQDMHFLLHSTNQRFLNSLSLREDDDFCSANKELNQGVNDESPETEHEPTDTDRMLNSTHRDAKTWVCHFYDSSKGRARGARCYYVHGATKLRQLKFGPPKLKPIGPSRNLTIRTMHPRVMYRKIFVGGLPPSVDSDYLKEFFQAAFGPVEEATVIGTPTGNYLQSRGFGFVTFEREETVAVAVETHFVTIFGKRVEIKSAVMKYVPEKGPTSPSYICRKVLDGTNSESSWWPNSPHCSKTDLQATELDNQTVTSLSEHNLPQWVTKFRKWLPSFLDEACKRLGEGEWYPLSSLKGDFRATCGLELDHSSLGFLKLSDFMRALPGLCKMQVVPVGNGPATHVVLFPLPSGPNHELFQNIGDKQQFSNMGDQQQFSASTIDKPSDAFELSQCPIAEARDRVLLPSKCQLEEKVYIDCTGFKEGKSNTLRSNMLDSIPWRIKTTNLTDVEHPILGRTEKGGALMIPLSEGEGTSRGSMQSPSSSLFQEQWDYCLLAKGRCIICHSRPSTSAIVPCNHKVCNWCISNTSLRKCILCGGEVQRFKPLEGVDPPNYTLSVLENPRLGMRKYPSLPIRQSMARPNFSGHDTACQLKYACQGATATVFCFPCRHRISCLSCLPRCQQNQPVVPKSCPACGGAVTKLEFADGFRDEDGEPLMDPDSPYDPSASLVPLGPIDDDVDDDWRRERSPTPVLDSAPDEDKVGKPRKRLVKNSGKGSSPDLGQSPSPEFAGEDLDDWGEEPSSSSKKRKAPSMKEGKGGSGKEKRKSLMKPERSAGKAGKMGMKGFAGGSRDEDGESEIKELWDTIAGGDSEDDKEGVRTLDDDNFIDDTGVDPDDRLYSDNEGSIGRAPQAEEGEEDDEINQLLKGGKKKKKNEKSPAELALIVEHLMAELEVTAEEDAELNRQSKPAINKLKKLPVLIEVLSKKKLQQEFLDHGVLTLLKNWLEPLPDGSLPNMNIRTAILKILADFPIDLEQYDRREQLKKSGLGKVIMFLSKSDEETTANRKLAKELVDKWSRPIFNKSTRFEDMRAYDDERAPYRRPSSKKSVTKAAGLESRDDDLDLADFSQGPKSGQAAQRQHASRPDALPMDFLVRPQSKIDPEEIRARAKQVVHDPRRLKMNKKLQQLKAPKKKQLQASKLSVEGRGMVKYL